MVWTPARLYTASRWAKDVLSNIRKKRRGSGTEQAGASDATILLIGEGGTGKSLLAKQIHLWSPRRAKPFVSIDCIRWTERSRESEKTGYALYEVMEWTRPVFRNGVA